MPPKKKAAKPARAAAWFSEPKKNVWKDDRDSSELYTASLRITVHHHIDHPPEEWLVTCHDLKIERKRLKSKTLAEAKIEGVEALYRHAHSLTAELGCLREPDAK